MSTNSIYNPYITTNPEPADPNLVKKFAFLESFGNDALVIIHGRHVTIDHMPPLSFKKPRSMSAIALRNVLWADIKADNIDSLVLRGFLYTVEDPLDRWAFKWFRDTYGSKFRYADWRRWENTEYGGMEYADPIEEPELD